MTSITTHHPPAHILDLVFQHTERAALKECRLACVSWYLLATPHLFHSIQINNTPQIDEFIDFHENPASDQLVQFGKYAKRVTIGRSKWIADKKMSLKNFEKFVKYCPEVTSVNLSQFIFGGSLHDYLFEVDDSIKWKIHRLDRFGYEQTFKLGHYYKYKDTIKAIRWLENILDFHFIIDFPLLEELALPSTVVIADIQDFMFICNTCSNLTKLDLYTNMNDNARLMADFSVCPSLKTLNVKCRSLMPKVLVDYITASLVNLSNVTFFMEITSIQSNFGEIYKQLDDFLFTPQKKVVSLTLKAETKYRSDNEQICTMIDECLNIACHPSKLKACNSLKRIVANSSVLTINLCKSWNHTIGCQVSIPSHLFIYLVKRNDFTSSKMPNFHKLCLEEEFIGLPLSEIVALFIEKACNLQELTLRGYSIKNTHSCVYEAVQILRIENSIINPDPDPFKGFDTSFPNLKELYLRNINMVGIGHSFKSKQIYLGDLPLQKLSLTIDKTFVFPEISMIRLVWVQTKRRRQFIKVCDDEIPRTITNKEGFILWKSSSVNRIFLKIWNAPARFELNNVYVELPI
ncbi:hypothetical protein RMCBS344292_15097 [Rhizopus microsporus]|nr:hypothetical protein RMCBS344292_15097 [Rhizopus microsporus]